MIGLVRRPGDSRRTSLGALRTRTVGVAFVQLFGRPGEGDGALYETAAAIAAVFSNQTVEDVRYGTPTVRVIGETPDGLYQINIECPFQADHQT